MPENKIKIICSDDVMKQTEERGIRIEDIEAVIAEGENGGAVLVSTVNDHILGKKKLDNFTVYAEYAHKGDEYEVYEAYGHKISLTSDLKE